MVDYHTCNSLLAANLGLLYNNPMLLSQPYRTLDSWPIIGARLRRRRKQVAFAMVEAVESFAGLLVFWKIKERQQATKPNKDWR
jgi:hypothetical protein